MLKALSHDPGDPTSNPDFKKPRGNRRTSRVLDLCCPGRDADLDFFLFIVDRYPEAKRPHVVVLYDGDAPKALLAGRLDVTELPIRVGYFALPVPKLKNLAVCPWRMVGRHL